MKQSSLVLFCAYLPCLHFLPADGGSMSLQNTSTILRYKFTDVSKKESGKRPSRTKQSSHSYICVEAL
jgi:hypothetical protein